ncbi:MAG TPA: methyl-accepting chemotaxis protein [Steroidobacteraceae bacterium]
MADSTVGARTGRQLLLLVGACALLVVLAALAEILTSNTAPAAAASPAVSALQAIALDAGDAGRGDPQALGRLAKSGEQLRAALGTGGTLASDASTKAVLANLDAVLRAQAPLTDAGAAARQVNDLVPRMVAEAKTSAAGLTGAALEAAARPLERFELLAQRLQLDLGLLASDAGAAQQAGERLAESADYMGLVVRGFQGSDTGLGLPRATGAAAEQHLTSLAAMYGTLSAAVRRAVSAAPALPAAQSASRALAGDARALAASAGAAPATAIAGGLRWLPLLLGLAALVPLVFLFIRLGDIRRGAERQRSLAEIQRKDTDRNQQAILRLLDELSSLADGDLTVQATVTEDITGAIADSINYAVEALRALVATINKSAIQLDGATRQTQALAQHLAKASGAQSKQIASATESIGDMAGSTEEVSGNAERASDVARHSVDVAHKGGDAVRRTIDGMNAIRETIQETSKRIKRLGESSQEIGNIVELINDIAEQTNILALNASIQASMAGEAGRGFAVVADEVQRLAERAANATKQIEVLVRTIQTDTNEAVVSMERSTTDVVGGALLAENAGAALEEIEQVSNQIASLVQNISGSSRQQAGAAQAVARNMQVLKEISSQTADSTSSTSAAIAKLAELSAGLRQSVSGFRLPGVAAVPQAARPAAAPAAANVPGATPAQAPAAPHADASGLFRQVSLRGGS